MSLQGEGERHEGGRHFEFRENMKLRGQRRGKKEWKGVDRKRREAGKWEREGRVRRGSEGEEEE